MDLTIRGKLALVTGSPKGIGFAIATELAQEGATVIVNGRTEAGVGEAVARLRSEVPGAQVEGLSADAGSAKGAQALVKSFPTINMPVKELAAGQSFDSFQTDFFKRSAPVPCSNVLHSRRKLPV